MANLEELRENYVRLTAVKTFKLAAQECNNKPSENKDNLSVEIEEHIPIIPQAATKETHKPYKIFSNLFKLFIKSKTTR